MKALSTYPLFIILLWLLAGLSAQANITLEPKDSTQVAAQYGKLPMSFEANRGQTDAAVRFLSRGAGYALYITPTEAVFSLRKAGTKPDAGADASHKGVGYAAHTVTPAGVTETSEKARTARPTPPQTPVGRAARAKPEAPTNAPDETLAVHMQLVGANPNASVAGLDELPGKVNYLRGNDPKRWQTGVATYGKVKLNGVYNGVDLVYYGNGRQLEYDFIVAPGADPNAIRLNFGGIDNARLDATGDLLLHTQDGELRLQKPVVYQTVDGKRQNVDGRFVLHDVSGREGLADGKDRHIGFQVAAYDAGLPLVIDPVLVYSSYLGGSSWESSSSIAVDTAGNAYVTGDTASSDFPTVNAKYPKLWGGSDAFVTKFSADGSKVLYSTYLGGSSWLDYVSGIAVDGAGNAYVTGTTASSDFPTVNAKYPKLWGGSDAFVTKFSPDGSKVLYSTYLGGSKDENTQVLLWSNIGSIAVDTTGNAYITGSTQSSDFPVVNAKYPTFESEVFFYEDGFVVKLSADGSKVLYSTYLGGNIGWSIAVDGAGNAYVAANTVVKFSADASKVLYFPYLNGATGITVDGVGNAYVTGTSSCDFPTAATDPKIISWDTDCNGGGDAFVAKFGTSYLEITPNHQDFGLATPGAVIDRTFTVKNTANRILTGTLVTTAPFSVVSGASFTLAAGAKKNITVRFAPTQKGFFKAALKATGNFPVISVQLQGIAALAVNHVPVISTAMLQ
ncbi:MAG: hypothetical protein EPN89_05315, partial [Methylovulum sp.]